MKVTDDAQLLVADVERAVSATAEPLQARLQAAVPRRTGRYAANTRVEVNGTTLRVVNALPQRYAVEFGADVGPRRGPHMKGSRAIEGVVDGRLEGLLAEGFRRG